MIKHSVLVASLSCGAFSTAFAAPVAQDAEDSVALSHALAVWITDQAPPERAILKADRATGGTRHLWSIDLRYPPEPVTDTDTANIKALDSVIVQAKERWLEFQVEYQIAADIEAALKNISYLDGDRDRGDVVAALFVEGAAVARVFDPDTFATDPRAEPYRVVYEGHAIPRAWLDAYAMSGKIATRTEMIDGTAWYHYIDVAKVLESIPKGSLEVPGGLGDVYVDARVVHPGVLTLSSGRHWIHIVRDGVVAARHVIDVAPSEVVPFPAAVSTTDLETAKAAVEAGKRGQIPDAVNEVTSRLSAYYGGPVFLAATDGKHIALLGAANGAQLTDDRLVTVLLAGDVGGGVVGALPGTSDSPVFDEAKFADDPTKAMFAGSGSISLSAEIGISYFLFVVGVDAYVTPGRTVAWSQKGENHYTSAFVEPWGGLGAYIIRPTKRTATLAIYGTAGWMSPSFPMYGARMVVGAPIDDKGNWFRVSLGGSYAPNTSWKPDDRAAYALPPAGETQPLFTGFLRIGFGSRL